jgi:hypothetical protein
MNTQRTAEWNMWYHVLNAGMRVAISGETDFPCITGEGVGIGRVYVQLDEPTLTYDRWVKNLAAGRSYVSDGTCHLLNFTAKEMDSLPVSSGQQLDTRNRLVTFSVSAAMRADHSQEIPVELIVNGYAVQTQIIPADGNIHPLSFDLELEQSSWVAIRCFPFAHTNPIYVVLEEEPILPSRASLLWCLMGVEQCWTSKQRTYAIDEQEDARKAYQHARETYSRLLSQFDNRFK